MKKTLRKKFIFFAMSAVTALLIVLIGAISIFSWIILDKQSDEVLHMLTAGEGKFLQIDFHKRGPFMPPMNLDTIQAARFFTVRMDHSGSVLETNLDKISSVTEEQAAFYAENIRGNAGKMDKYKYEIKQLGKDRVIFFMDTSGQVGIFIMVCSIAAVIAVVCWLVIFLFVILLSGRVVRPVLAGIEKQKQFITNAGHELKTPLAIIQSNNDASTLIFGETKYSKNIQMQTKRLNVLMTNLLTLAKLDEEIKLPTEMLDISSLLHSMFPAYEDVMLQKEMEVSVDIQPSIFLNVHEETFLQMISILLDNAVKYTPHGGIVIFSVQSSGGHIYIIEENSCETPCHGEPERLFERFYRGDSARTQKHSVSGFGIGLSAARAIAETFGGRLTAAYTERGTIRFMARF